MRIGMIADFVPRRSHFAGNPWQPPDVCPALEKGRGRAMPGQDLKQRGRGLAGAIVKG
jgi:hypothetical protein